MKTEYHPKQYFSKGKTVKWGEDLTQEEMSALREGEIFILLDENGQPHSEVLMDSSNQIRERRCKVEEKEVTEIHFNLTKMEAKLICHDCLDVFDGNIYYLTMTQPDKEGAVWSVAAPTDDKPAFCPKCVERKKKENETKS